MRLVYTEHVRHQMEERDISESEIKGAVCRPTQVIKDSSGRLVAQRIYTRNGRRMLLRVFHEKQSDVCTIITAYWTSKIKKYFPRRMNENSI